MASAADARQPCAGRYVHQWAAEPSHPSIMGFGAYVGRDGRYAGALQFKGREESLQLPTDADSFRRIVVAALPSLPKVRLCRIGVPRFPPLPGRSFTLIRCREVTEKNYSTLIRSVTKLIY